MVANTENESAQFGIANIPFGIVSTSHDAHRKAATRYLDKVLLLPDLIANGHFAETGIQAETLASLSEPTLNRFAALGRAEHRAMREALQKFIRNGNIDDSKLNDFIVPISDIICHLPVHVGDFSDFSCSKDHVLNAGEAVLGVRQLPPGFPYFPVGYGGRSSSILAPGSSVRRPLGQYRSAGGVAFGPSKAVDFELEVAAVIGKPTKYSEPVDINESEEHIFGFLLLNDWSARDIQGFEMNPLGPFNGKSFGTSISSWIITLDALEPFRTIAPPKDPAPAAYLQNHNPEAQFSIQLGVEIQTDEQKHVVCEAQFEWMYWTVSDMIAHQTINGCPLNAGDFLATGTVSGSTPGSNGCLLEITKGGKQPCNLSAGQTRTYLEDGDIVRLTGHAGQPGTDDYIGFGSCFGQLLPSINNP